MGGAMFAFDCADPLVLEAYKESTARFADLLVFQDAPRAQERLRVGLCTLSRLAHSTKVQLVVKVRLGEMSLRDFRGALGKLAPTASSDEVDGGRTAVALHQLLTMAGKDRDRDAGSGSAAGVAQGQGQGQQSWRVVVLTDRMYQPEDLERVLQFGRDRGVGLDLYFASTAGTIHATAEMWQQLEAQFPNLRVTVLEAPGAKAFQALSAVFMERYGRPPSVLATLQFKAPLVGEVRSLQLTARPAVQRLCTAVEHAPLCPCHKLPGLLRGPCAGTCSVTGELLSSRSASKDASTIQLGIHAGGLLHFATPFSVAVGAGRQGVLNVVQRVKREQLNPACQLGTPLLLEAHDCSIKLAHEDAVLDVTHSQLLQALAAGLRDNDEALIASSSMDLETGQAGLIRHFFSILPLAASDSPPVLVACRLAAAEELPASPASGTAAAQLPAALADAVRDSLASVQLGPYDPLALSSRCHETVEMLLLESRPLPRPLPAPQQPAAAAATPAAVEASGAAQAAAVNATPQLNQPATVPKPGQPEAAVGAAPSGVQAAAVPTAKGKGKKAAAKQVGGGRVQQSGRAGLELHRTKR